MTLVDLDLLDAGSEVKFLGRYITVCSGYLGSQWFWDEEESLGYPDRDALRYGFGVTSPIEVQSPCLSQQEDDGFSSTLEIAYDQGNEGRAHHVPISNARGMKRRARST